MIIINKVQLFLCHSLWIAPSFRVTSFLADDGPPPFVRLMKFFILFTAHVRAATANSFFFFAVEDYSVEIGVAHEMTENEDGAQSRI